MTYKSIQEMVHEAELVTWQREAARQTKLAMKARAKEARDEKPRKVRP